MDQEQREQQSSSKRRRVDDGTPPHSPRKPTGPAKPDWDNMTFRVSRIPENFDLGELTQAIAHVLDLKPTDFKIHSLALDACDEADPPCKAATISFRKRPALLERSQDFADAWKFELPQALAGESGCSSIYFDTHFEGFTPLSPADQDTERAIDCIIIPGWGGHALGSFRSHTSPYVWLRDSLPIHCPELYVWTYGYHLHLTDPNSSADVYEFAERFRRRLRILRQQTKAIEEVRPLIFIAHSLGGWIFKDAMIQMKESPNEFDRKNFLSTYGALFFGVPTQGMNVAAIASMVQDLPARYISALLDQQDGFRLRQRQHQAFCKAFDYKDSKIFQFFEMKKSDTVIQHPETKEWSRNGPPALLVTPASASYGRAWETDSEHCISLDSNHSDMVKFSEHDHHDYPIVREVLRDFTRHAELVIKCRAEESSKTLILSEPRHLTSEHQACLQSLHFSEMNRRKNDIEVPKSDTCEWIFEHPSYLKWSNQQHGLLWIKGSPGVGKSTVLKHALEVAERTGDEEKVLASFFFHGRGVLIQKSVLGLFRCLLHQLLQKLPELLAEFSCLYEKRTQTEGQYGVKWDWHERELQDFFKTSVVEAASAHKICLYIDALDESGEDVAIYLVDFFRRFGSPIAICFSCRHYPVVALENGLEICVEGWNYQDINTYIRTSIEDHILRADIANPIQNEIAAKSLGNFQWVVLVVPRVLRLYRNGNSLAFLKTNIKQIPSELSDLYKELLDSTNEEHLSQTLNLMQWILFALRPLTLAELRFALVMNADSSCTSIRQCQSSNTFLRTDEELKRRILSLSQGLVEVCELNTDNSEDYESQDGWGQSQDSLYGTEYLERIEVVQFTHQSVKDYLLEGGLQLMDKDSSGSVIGRGHFCLSRSCIKYLDMEEIRCSALSPYDESSLDEETSDSDEETFPRDFTLDFPLLHYSLKNWLFHLAEVEDQKLPQEDLLSLLWKPSSRVLQTCIEMSHRMTWKTVYPQPELDPLHMASNYNLLSVVNAILARDCEADLRDKFGETPLLLAAQKGNEAVTKSLLERKDVNPNSQDIDGLTSLSWAALKGHRTIVMRLLARDDVDADLKDENGRTPLSWASYYGHNAIVKLLLKRNDIDVDGKDYSGHTPLFYAVTNLKEEVVKTLLERKDIDLDQRVNSERQTILHVACDQSGHNHRQQEMIKLLLEKIVEIDKKDIEGRTPLYLASQARHVDIIELLLSRGADPNPKRRDGITPVLMAMGSVNMPLRYEGGSRNQTLIVLLQRIDVNVVLEDIKALQAHDRESAEDLEKRKQWLREEFLMFEQDHHRGATTQMEVR